VDTGITYKMAADDDMHLLSDCGRAVCRNGIVSDEAVSQNSCVYPYLVVAGRGGISTPHFFVRHFRPPQLRGGACRPTRNQWGWAQRWWENPKMAATVATQRMRFADRDSIRLARRQQSYGHLLLPSGDTKLCIRSERSRCERDGASSM
jgi:hypothetical protein